MLYRIETVTKKTRKKTKNKMYTPHYTISHTHTPQEWKTSKNRRKFLACRQTGIHYENACVNVTTARQSKKNKQSNVHAYFPFQLPLHVLYSVHELERTWHHPASVMIYSHSVSLHDFILNKTSCASYATEYFVCPHQLRFHNSLSN